MATYLVRRTLTAKGGLKVGADGTTASKILSGQIEACVPAITASGGTSTGSLAITGVAAGDQVFLSSYNQATNAGAVAVTAAVACAANNVSACFVSSTGSAVGAQTASFNYFVIG